MNREKIDFKEIQCITGITEENEPKSIILFEFLIYNFNTGKYDTISNVSLFEPEVNIKFIPEGVILDLCFPKDKKNYFELFEFFNFYQELQKNEDIIVAQRLTIFPSNDPSNQYIFTNPIFTEKNGNKVGRTLDGFRFFYKNEDFINIKLDYGIKLSEVEVEE